MSVEEKSDCSIWSREQDKAFENAIATHSEDSEDRWEKIAADVAGKTIEEVKDHYEILLEDINEIESGRVPLPSYSSSSEGLTGDKKKSQSGSAANESNHGGKASKADQERRKGIAWTEDEHRLFLLGLEKYGKGDWRSISRNFVVTRTPTQVASHAQKYFVRLNSMNKERRRSSIHDITSVNGADLSTSQGPITGQTNTALSAPSSAKSNKQASSNAPGVGIYSAPTIGQPMSRPAIGTPVHLSAPPHMVYGARVPVPGSASPMSSQKPHSSTHR
ncbi:transcription factor SRM1 [Silene latifolia]|uniref:transcription factor SRM1 n=1 Tax=Silene latifolia TaxID=37657 RepID=UPI003D78ACD6